MKVSIWNKTEHSVIKWSVAAALGLMLSGSFASAAVINESFSSPVGGLPSDWTLSANGDASTSKIVTVGSVNYLQLGVDNSTTQNAAIYYNGGDTTATMNSQFGDFTGSVVVHYEDNGSVGDFFRIVLRAQSPTYNDAGGYYISLAPKAANLTGHLKLFKATTDGTAPTLVASSSNDGGSFGSGAYLLTFSMDGSTLTAKWWHGGSGQQTELYASVTADVGNDYSSGYIGLRSDATMKNENKYIYFGDMEVNSVPEPATLALLGLAGGLTLIRRRRS